MVDAITLEFTEAESRRIAAFLRLLGEEPTAEAIARYIHDSVLAATDAGIDLLARDAKS